MAWLKWIALGFVALYLAALIYVYVAQRKFMYFPPPAPIPQDVFAGRILPISVEGIGEINSIYSPPPTNGAPVILFIHGNGSAAHQYEDHYEAFSSWGAGYLGMEYPGYAANVGTPNERDILKTALSNYDALIAKGIAPENIIIFGHSMGAASAVHVAKNRESAGLVLGSPFLSMQAMSRLQMPFFPTSLVLKDTYRSDQRIGSVTQPLLVLHGEKDELIPHSQGKALFGLHKGEKNFVLIKNGQHMLWGEEMANHIKIFTLTHARN